nr:protein Aatf-like isoform X2 [Ipomoea trifida]
MKEMGKSRKRSQQIKREESESGSEFDSDEMLDDMLPNGDSNGDNGDYSHDDEDEEEEGNSVLWDKTLELRFLLQKAFSNSNRLPQEPIKSSFCDYGDEVSEAYSDLIGSSKKTLDSILELQEALLEKNPSITQSTDGSEVSEASHQSIGKSDEEWLQITQMHSRMSSFRDKSVDKWQRRTQVTSGAAAVKGKLHAFNQSISQQVGNYMRDPSKMIKGMQLSRSAVALFGTVPDLTATQEEGTNADGNPELLDDSDFYQQLLKEFFETIDPTSSGFLDTTFKIKDLGSLGYFLGMEIKSSAVGLNICQRKHALDILEEAGFLGSKLSNTPMAQCLKLNHGDGTLLEDASSYRRLIARHTRQTPHLPSNN